MANFCNREYLYFLLSYIRLYQTNHKGNLSLSYNKTVYNYIGSLINLLIVSLLCNNLNIDIPNNIWSDFHLQDILIYNLILEEPSERYNLFLQEKRKRYSGNCKRNSDHQIPTTLP